MNTELENPSERLDPLVVGVFASAPLTDATRRVLLEQQTACAAVETAEKMAERARLMFVTMQNGPHSSGMLPCRLCATNGLLELVSTAAHALWTAHRSEIRAMCPELWDEELTRGWLLADSLGRWFDTGAAVRTVGKRAAAQTLAAAKRARAEGKRARTKAPQPEARDAAAEAARKEVWAEAYGSLLNGLQSVSRPHRPSALALVQSPAAINMPTTCPAAGEPRQPSAAADLTQADCCLLRFGASVSPAPPLAVAPPEPAPAPAPAPSSAASPEEASRARESKEVFRACERERESAVDDMLDRKFERLDREFERLDAAYKADAEQQLKLAEERKSMVAAEELTEEVAFVRKQLQASKDMAAFWKDKAAKWEQQAENSGQLAEEGWQKLAMANARLKEASERLEAKEADYRCCVCSMCECVYEA